MKKFLLALVVVAMSAGMAQATNDQKCCKKDAKCEKTECCEKKQQCHKKPCKGEPRCFQGIELTAEQKAKIQALNADCKAKRCEAAKCEKAQKMEARKAERAEYTAKVKAILTPEQFAQFEANQKTCTPKPMKKGPECGRKPKCEKTCK